ncbi:hypothetical protein NA57DRAFT_75086 [Rhizodiscina lignyota]|uniref:Mucin n=1 Tax=Rhizodiscina lignyota TaxID=1504668 RepID=A0A9P4IK20_9PEZI|nr:hypothetical protein NA57DRAFT_75086 [Rhizodiscina lignyota]
MPAMVFFHHQTPTASTLPPPSDPWKREATAAMKKHHSGYTISKPTLTEAEFAELPPSIQRKYFSSVERLRIAEHTASVLSRTRPIEQPARSVRHSKSIPSSLDQVARSNSKKRRRLRKPEAALYDQLVSQNEAQWFLNLPEKVRRQQFSREEQILFASRCDSLALDSTDEASPSVPSVPFQNELPPPRTPVRPKTSSSLGTTCFEQSPVPIVEEAVSIKYFRPDDMASCFDPSFTKRSRRPSTRRTRSMSGVSTRHSTSSVPPLLPSPFMHQAGSAHKRAISSAPRASESSASAFDPNAVHYSDPEARMKLRMYLGSPQKFDEALEFGFPSGEQAEVPLTADRSVHFLAPLTLTHDFQSFLNDDWLSFLDSDEELDDDDEVERESLPDAESPVTPGESDEMFRNSPRVPSQMASVESGPSAPRPSSSYKQKTDVFGHSVSGSREMTLRMTLTRPDLRANEVELYGWQGKPKDDPLALEELPISDDMNGGQSPFTTKPNRKSGRMSMKQFLNKVRKERR